MKKFIISIIYNFDIDIIQKVCESKEQAVHTMNQMLAEEVQTVMRENQYAPVVVKHDECNVTLMYITEDELKALKASGIEHAERAADAAFYRIFEIEVNSEPAYALVSVCDRNIALSLHKSKKEAWGEMQKELKATSASYKNLLEDGGMCNEDAELEGEDFGISNTAAWSNTRTKDDWSIFEIPFSL